MINMENKINQLANEIVSNEFCPIDLFDCKHFKRFDAEKLINFFKEEKEGIKAYDDPKSHHYSPLFIFEQIRRKIEMHIVLQENQDKNLVDLKDTLKENYNRNSEHYLAKINTELMEKINRCGENWDEIPQQTAINVYHSLILYIYACDFYKHEHPKKVFRRPGK